MTNENTHGVEPAPSAGQAPTPPQHDSTINRAASEVEVQAHRSNAVADRLDATMSVVFGSLPVEVGTAPETASVPGAHFTRLTNAIDDNNRVVARLEALAQRLEEHLS